MPGCSPRPWVGQAKPLLIDFIICFHMVSWLDFPSCPFILLSFLSYSFILWAQNSFWTKHHWKQIKSNHTIHPVLLCIPKLLFSPYSFSNSFLFPPSFLPPGLPYILTSTFLLLLCLAYCLSFGLNLCHAMHLAQFISFSLYFFPSYSLILSPAFNLLLNHFFLSSFDSTPPSATLTFSRNFSSHLFFFLLPFRNPLT